MDVKVEALQGTGLCVPPVPAAQDEDREVGSGPLAVWGGRGEQQEG